MTAWERQKQCLLIEPMRKVFEEKRREEARLRAEWEGPDWIADAVIPHWANNHERIELLDAYDNQNPQVLRKIA